MSLVKTIGMTAIVGLVGLGVFATDYSLQWSKAESEFGAPQYIVSLYDRFGDSGGAIGLMLRKSSMVYHALPNAPAGWAAYDWDPWADDLLYSAQQYALYTKHVDHAIAGMTQFDDPNTSDLELFQAYHTDTTVFYEQGPHGIGLWINDKTKPINSPLWRDAFRRVDAHFDTIDRKSSYGTFQGLTWSEVSGPIDAASNGDLPFELRFFEAQIKDVSLVLTTRASDKMVRSFLTNVDLSGVRDLADFPLPQGHQPPSPKPLDMSEPMLVSSGQQPRVTRPNAQCGQGTFCKVGQ